MNHDAKQVQAITVEAVVLRAGRCTKHEHLDEPVPCADCAATTIGTEDLGVVAEYEGNGNG